MNKNHLITALLGTLAMLTIAPYANAQSVTSTPAIDTPVQPIYPTEEQQTGKLWGSTEVLHCPNGTKLIIEGKSHPLCIPMTFDELNGQVGGVQ